VQVIIKYFSAFIFLISSSFDAIIISSFASVFASIFVFGIVIRYRIIKNSKKIINLFIVFTSLNYDKFIS
jgi:hypothetical protein